MNIEKLVSDGWKELPKNKHENHSRNWFKRYPSVHRCCCNDDKAGIQIELREWDFKQYGKEKNSYEILTTAELPDGRWPRFGMSVDEYNLESSIALIICAWDYMNEAIK